ncbi:MAG: putative zinc-binding metallopeptidase [Bdellovibrionales bacterium]|nr:putative zinc-binding metallopeptidase [Bdellovibrionales bacterium]
MSSSNSYFWENYSDEKLLDLRFCDLGLQLEGSRVEPFVHQLYEELAQKDLQFQPHCWVSEEWFAADGIPGIAVPFFVLHKRLARLEKKMLLDVEGYSKRDCMKLLRHEAGHAIDNAFRLRKNKRRQKMFGLSSTPYPTYYSPQAYSKKYVVHLNSWYAQSHPDEDWAESFAVWLNPNMDWKKRYSKWPALKKLKLLDEIMQSIQGKAPPVNKRERPGELKKSRKKLRTYYKAKVESLGLDEPFFMDPFLRKVFSSESEFKKNKRASTFIREEKKLISAMVARWTGQYRYTINLILDEMILSCREKKMRLRFSEEETKIDLVGMLTAQSLNYISSGRHHIPM